MNNKLIAEFPAQPPRNGEPVTWAQAQEMLRRFLVDLEAAPTVAVSMRVDYDVVCSVLDGKLHPGDRQQWIDKVLP